MKEIEVIRLIGRSRIVRILTTSAAPICLAISIALLPVVPDVRAADAGSNVANGPYVATLVSANILSVSTFPGSSSPVADVSAVLLPDGTIRAYVFATGLGTVMADSSDAKTFTYKGSPFGGNNFRGQPRVIKLANGTWVMYNASSDGFSCSTSSDGLTFTVQTEVCLSKTQFAGIANGLTGPGVVRLANGTYRAYFSDLPRPGTGPDPWKVFSATSPDGLTWTAEPGVRIGDGAQNITRSAEHPTVVRHSDGTFTMFYFDNASRSANKSTGMGLYYATSTDGLVFTNENKLDLVGLGNGFENSAGNDPEVFLDGAGRLLMYFGIGPAGIAAVRLTRATSSGNSSTTTTPAKTTSSTPKIGGPCPKSGQRKTVGKAKFLCKLVKGRTSWVKG
jgi:hypothetical protein